MRAFPAALGAGRPSQHCSPALPRLCLQTGLEGNCFRGLPFWDCLAMLYMRRKSWLFWKCAGELVLPSLRKQMCWRESAAGTHCAPCARLPRQVRQLRRVLPRNCPHQPQRFVLCHLILASLWSERCLTKAFSWLSCPHPSVQRLSLTSKW